MTQTHDATTQAKLDHGRLQTRLMQAEANYASLLAATRAAADCGDLHAKLAEEIHMGRMHNQEAQRHIDALEGELVQFGEALTELVELKRMHDAAGGNATLEYAQRKPLAWDKAYALADRYKRILVKE